MRLLAPLLGLLLVYLGWRLWRVAGRGPLGRAARWWAVALVLAVFVAGLVYGAAAPPADPDVRAVQRAQADSLLRHTPLPAPLAAPAPPPSPGAAARRRRWRASHLGRPTPPRSESPWRRLRRRRAVAAGAVRRRCSAPGWPAAAPSTSAGSAPAQVPEPGALGAPGATLWVGTPSGLNRLRQGAPPAARGGVRPPGSAPAGEIRSPPWPPAGAGRCGSPPTAGWPATGRTGPAGSGGRRRWRAPVCRTPRCSAWPSIRRASPGRPPAPEGRWSIWSPAPPARALAPSPGSTPP